MQEIWRLSAVDALKQLDAGSVSSEDLIGACLHRIGEADDVLKAFITVSGERAIDEARASDARRRAGASRPLEGLPFAVKDVIDTAGVRTTFGSTFHANNVPAEDDLAVARLRQDGAIVIGKTNLPEFGFGPRSTNRLFGPTANPYDVRLSSGGSSGGSAVALAAGMAPLALGTDFGGSVRTPASFCGVVGLRPTPGYIPLAGKSLAWNALSTHGVMARSIEDAALMLAAVGGYDRRDPLSHPGRGPVTVDATMDAGALRVAFSEDFGVAPVAREVGAGFRAAIAEVAAHVPACAEATPDCAGATQAFAALRAGLLYRQFGGLLDSERDRLTEQFSWNVARGAGLTAEALLTAEETRSRIHASFARFFQAHDVLVTPSVAVMPFPNTQEEVLEIDGVPLASPIDYLAISSIVSLIGWPCLSIPGYWTPSGLPLGLQLIVPPWHEGRLLAFAALLERELGFRHRWPGDGQEGRSLCSSPRREERVEGRER